jgi:DNA-binding transcriptional MerR regulator
MHKYSIGQICKILKVKPHVLRYWEQEFPLLSPGKDTGGRRVYTDADLNILFRLHYLLYEQRFTVEGAKKQIWSELQGNHINFKAQVQRLRATLLEAESRITKTNDRLKSFILTDKNDEKENEGEDESQNSNS